jgi:hypothetical protein
MKGNMKNSKSSSKEKLQFTEVSCPSPPIGVYGTGINYIRQWRFDGLNSYNVNVAFFLIVLLYQARRIESMPTTLTIKTDDQKAGDWPGVVEERCEKICVETQEGSTRVWIDVSRYLSIGYTTRVDQLVIWNGNYGQEKEIGSFFVWKPFSLPSDLYEGRCEIFRQEPTIFPVTLVEATLEDYFSVPKKERPDEIRHAKWIDFSKVCKHIARKRQLKTSAWSDVLKRNNLLYNPAHPNKVFILEK